MRGGHPSDPTTVELLRPFLVVAWHGPGELAETESAFKGTLAGVVTYRKDSKDVHSVRFVVDGTYLYRARQATDLKMVAAIESRPE